MLKNMIEYSWNHSNLLVKINLVKKKIIVFRQNILVESVLRQTLQHVWKGINRHIWCRQLRTSIVQPQCKRKLLRINVGTKMRIALFMKDTTIEMMESGPSEIKICASVFDHKTCGISFKICEVTSIKSYNRSLRPISGNNCVNLEERLFQRIEFIDYAGIRSSSQTVYKGLSHVDVQARRPAVCILFMPAHKEKF